MPAGQKKFGAHRSTLQIAFLVFKNEFSPKIATNRNTKMVEKMDFKKVFTKDAKFSEQHIGLTRDCHRWKALRLERSFCNVKKV